MARVLLGVKNLNTAAAVEEVTTTLTAVEGVKRVAARLDGQAAVEYDESEITVMDIIRALRKRGFVAGMV
jgi:copper chaperone CopZ